MPFNSNTNRTNLPPDVSGNLDDEKNSPLTQPCVKYVNGEYWIINPVRDKETKEIIDYQPLRPCNEGDINNDLLIPADWIPGSSVSLAQAKQELKFQLKDYFQRKKSNNDFLAQLAQKQHDFVESKVQPITAETTLEEFIANPKVSKDDKIINYFLLSIMVEDPENPMRKVSLRTMLAKKQAAEDLSNPQTALIEDWVNSKETLNPSKSQKKSTLPLYKDNFLHQDPNFNDSYYNLPVVTFDPSEKARPGYVYVGQSGKSPLYSPSSHELIAPALNNNYIPPRFRTSEVAEAASALSGQKRGGVLLTGEAGVGKSLLLPDIGIEVSRILKYQNKVAKLFEINIQQHINAGSSLFGEHQKKTGALKADIEYERTGKRLWKHLYLKKYSIDMEWLESIVAKRTPLGTISAAEIVNQSLDQLADILYKAGKLPEVIVMLGFDEAHTMIEAGKNGDSTSAFLEEFKLWIESGLCRPILITTIAEKDKFLKDPALRRRLTEIILTELTSSQTMEILKDLIAEKQAELRDKTPFIISEETLEDLLELSNDKLVNVKRPAAPIKLLENVITDAIKNNYFETKDLVKLREKINDFKRKRQFCRPSDIEYKLFTDQINEAERIYSITEREINAKNEAIKQKGGIEITKDDIVNSAAKQLNTDSFNLVQNPKEEKKRLETGLYSNVIGHDAALDKIIKMYVNRMSPLEARRKTPFVMLLTGVPGVGKTEIGKVIAKTNHLPILELAMNQFQSPASESNLIGSPRGTIDSDRKTPFLEFITTHKAGGVIILDEAEKAYPGIMNKFLQIFDSGFYIDDQTNEKIDCRNFTFILTSNALEEQLASNPNMPTDKLIDALKNYTGTSNYGHYINAEQPAQVFSAALLSRVGRNVFGFGNLSQGEMFQLVELKLKQMAEDLLDTPVKLHVDFGSPTKEYMQARDKYQKSIASKSESEQIKKMRQWDKDHADMKYPEDSIVYYLLSVIREQNGDGRLVSKIIEEKITTKLKQIVHDSESENFKNKTVKITSGFNPETEQWDVMISDPYVPSAPVKVTEKKSKKAIKKM